jgi:hypothetical protein
MDNQREANPRELTEEEIKTVSGGTTPTPSPGNGPKSTVPWSNVGGIPDGNWRDHK